jgi:peptide/nickel transport system substrate-binding protein
MTLLNKRFWQRGLASLLALVMAIVLSGCSLDQFKVQAAQVSQVVAYAGTDPKTFNYALSQESPNVFSLTFDALVDEDGEGNIIPELAESWQVSEDKLRIVFTLRKDLKWSDGKPLTVDDVIFSYNDVYFNEAIPTATRESFLIGVKATLPTVRKLDEQRIEFITPEPFAPLIRATGSGIILPKHILQKAVQTKDADGKPRFLSTWGTDTDPTQIIVNGPYRIESYTPLQRVVFRRNPYYWRKDAQGNPKPYVERIIWQLTDNPDTALLQFRSGGLDTLNISARTFSLLKREEKRGHFTIHNSGPDSGTTFIAFNLNQGKRNGKPLVDPVKSRWFNKVEFRQAVAYGLNRQAMINNTLRGLGEPQDSPISVQSPYYLSREEGLKFYDYNPQKAKDLLLKAGFKYNTKGELLDADGNRVRFTLIAPAGGRDLIGAQIKQDLSKIGMQVDYQPINFGVLVDKLSNSLDWECHYLAFTGGVEPNDGANIWNPNGPLHSFNQVPQPGQAPITDRVVQAWEQKIWDLYVRGAQEFDEAKRKAIYAETQQLSQEYLPFIHLVNVLALSVTKDRVQDVKPSALKPGPYSVLWNAYDLKVADKPTSN